MQLYPDRLAQHLQQPLKPVYIVAGDEPLLHLESCQLIRDQAKAQGYDERIIIDADAANADWSSLTPGCATLSLFSQRQLIEVRFGDKKPSKDIQTLLTDYADHPFSDLVVLLSFEKLDKGFKTTRWFKRLEKIGVFIPIYPIAPHQLNPWLSNRLRQNGFQADASTVALFAQRIEGNLLAAAQEIEKLKLLLNEPTLTSAFVEHYISDSAHFDVFRLTDNLLTGDVTRSLNVLSHLKAEGIEPILILWAIAKETRTLLALHEGLAQRLNWADLCRQHFIWDNKKAAYQQALKRLTRAELKTLLPKLVQIDQMIKGLRQGETWDQLQDCIVILSGQAAQLA